MNLNTIIDLIIKKMLCNKLNIYRITNIEYKDKCLFIIMPIVINSITVLKVVVWKYTDRADYYDLFVLRLSYAFILEIYEIGMDNGYEFFNNELRQLINKYCDKIKLIVAHMRIVFH